MRTAVAVWAGKGTRWLLRRLGREATSLPGMVSRLVSPTILQDLSRQAARGVVLVTGTNGKTTTARMVAAALSHAGRRVVHNRAGANLPAGLVAALVEHADLLGRLQAEEVLLEVDEATLPAVAPRLQPHVVTVTNFFRDQLDRYGELSRTVHLVGEGLAALGAAGTAVLNVDDPLVVTLLDKPRRAVGYGVDAPAEAGGEPAEVVPREATVCPRCGGPLRYACRHYGHLGHYRCPRCGFSRPEPAVRLLERREGEDGQQLKVAVDGRVAEVHVPLLGRYNAYNVLAALATAHALGLDVAQAASALRGFRPSFGRMEVLTLPGGARAVVALVKNPIGLTEVLHALVARKGPRAVLFLIHDLPADGTDVSWLWDADVEILAEETGIRVHACGGLRGADMAVRLKYAGVPPERILLLGESRSALAEMLRSAEAGEEMWILPTYTALLEVRRELFSRGLVESPFGEVRRSPSR